MRLGREHHSRLRAVAQQRRQQPAPDAAALPNRVDVDLDDHERVVQPLAVPGRAHRPEPGRGRRCYIHRRFTGLRGGGKTTELLRLQAALMNGPSGQRYFVSFLDADDSLDLDDANPTDLVLSIVPQLVSDLRAQQVQGPPAAS